MFLTDILITKEELMEDVSSELNKYVIELHGYLEEGKPAPFDLYRNCSNLRSIFSYIRRLDDSDDVLLELKIWRDQLDIEASEFDNIGLNEDSNINRELVQFINSYIPEEHSISWTSE